MNNKKIAVFSAISGLITSAAFIFENIYLIIFISITPPIYFVIKNRKIAFTAMFFFLFTFYFFSDLWLFSVGISISSSVIAGYILSAVLLLLISLILTITASVGFLLIKYSKTKNKFTISLEISFIFIFGEWVHGLFFPWNRLCNILCNYNEFLGSVSFFGGLFISFIIIIINICFSYSFIYINLCNKSIKCIITAVLVFTANLFLSSFSNHIYNYSKTNSSEIIIVQPDYSKEAKKTKTPMQALTEQLDLAEKNITSNTRMIVFPETSITEKVFTNKQYKNIIYKFINKYNVNVIFGSVYETNNNRYNCCALISKSDKDIYMKRTLVPFGEYTPSFIPTKIQFLKNSFTKALDTKVLKSNIGNIGCLICFESIFPELSIENMNSNAQLTFIISNDSWIGNNVPLYQHHSHSVIRAIESRKYTVTCANTGISSVISPDGKIIDKTQKNTKQVIKAIIYPNNIRTLYCKTGDIIVLPAILIIIILLINIVNHKKNLHKSFL